MNIFYEKKNELHLINFYKLLNFNSASNSSFNLQINLIY